jgi:hypothetical protein
MMTIDDFFFYDHNIAWKPLPKHSLEQSPCYPIIGMHREYPVPFYYCRLHPRVENIYLQSIEHHCKFSKPEVHKSELLKSLKEILSSHVAEGIAV